VLTLFFLFKAFKWDDESIISVLIEHAERASVPKDTVLLQEGEKIQTFYIVKNGSVRVEKVSSSF